MYDQTLTTLTLGAGVLAAGILLYWELSVCEGAHLGPRVVTWLYDRFAARYDGVKKFDDDDEAYYLAGPLLAELDAEAPFVLDVAAGTGRVPLALLREPRFNGRVVGLDLSRAMLAQAAPKLAPYRDRAALLRHAARPLPFPDETFDALTCLEALEFMPDPAPTLAEFARVLRPGGLLLVSRRKSRLLFGLVHSRARDEQLVRAAGLERVTTHVWQVDYDQVWARKPGALARGGVRRLSEVLRCPRCRATGFVETPGAWQCPGCGKVLHVEENGVIEF
jgi:ubiquinone/menaquinone biosynthesis C-methylase UbiE